ncbi:hypothetical protein EV715DRAFT_296982 [Schizophyllum commune]
MPARAPPVLTPAPHDEPLVHLATATSAAVRHGEMHGRFPLNTQRVDDRYRRGALRSLSLTAPFRGPATCAPWTTRTGATPTTESATRRWISRGFTSGPRLSATRRRPAPARRGRGPLPLHQTSRPKHRRPPSTAAADAFHLLIGTQQHQAPRAAVLPLRLKGPFSPHIVAATNADSIPTLAIRRTRNKDQGPSPPPQTPSAPQPLDLSRDQPTVASVSQVERQRSPTHRATTPIRRAVWAPSTLSPPAHAKHPQDRESAEPKREGAPTPGTRFTAKWE